MQRVVSPPDHNKVYGGTPPEGEAQIPPSAAPKHDGMVNTAVAVICGGARTVTLVMLTHPDVSVTVTVYVPGQSNDIGAAVLPVDHSNDVIAAGSGDVTAADPSQDE